MNSLDHLDPQLDLIDSRSDETDIRRPARPSRRIPLILCAVLFTIGPTVLALAIGVRVAESLRILVLTATTLGCAYVLLRPR
ncbi:hypothetical protein DEU38_1323 [Rhodococcus sp. AG1013]|nr:hypothetical protein DEU38_1323 [Rhodococcus sp. AG1013]